MIAKSSALERKIHKWAKVTKRQQEAKARKGQSERKWRALSAMVKHRDGGKCRICQRLTTTVGDPRLIGQCHHVVFRSAGGLDNLSNLVHCCAQCHDDIHRHLITLYGTADRLTITHV